MQNPIVFFPPFFAVGLCMVFGLGFAFDFGLCFAHLAGVPSAVVCAFCP